MLGARSERHNNQPAAEDCEEHWFPEPNGPPVPLRFYLTYTYYCIISFGLECRGTEEKVLERRLGRELRIIIHTSNVTRDVRGLATGGTIDREKGSLSSFRTSTFTKTSGIFSLVLYIGTFQGLRWYFLFITRHFPSTIIESKIDSVNVGRPK